MEKIQYNISIPIFQKGCAFMSPKALRRLKKFLLSLPSVALFILSLVTLGGADCVLMLVSAVLLVPIDEWQDLLDEKLHSRLVKYIVIGALIVGAAVLWIFEPKDRMYNIYQSPEIVDKVEDWILEKDPNILDEIPEE